ncbi:aspartate-semialdehyde dehydrogenase [Tieghemiomyces parasiticus]|uniref:Aspartate-semialdehyde dehydrogenase n=1 Tax=Tieghemiomyces parasiticus TaxID=78921 RepID=A0A9W8A9N1_9FUNG|nr:aspartate-semialdehyde dehydrogenase [Tieghemiomyces parasiticus]
MSNLPARKLRAGILGATGTVGQRFISLLESHPLFVVHTLGASARSAGQTYGQVVRWKVNVPYTSVVGDLVVQPCEPDRFRDCDVIFSGLDSSVAGEIETAFLKADLAVLSNAKNHRMAPDVPLIVPTANPEHLAVVQHQRARHNLERGFLVTNANCSTTGLVVVLRALQDAFGPMSHVIVQTMQAVSGAGYPGVSSLDILDNVVPLIDGEEEKMESEVAKILGSVLPDQSGFQHLENTVVSATCNRVAVIDGHTECVSVKFARSAVAADGSQLPPPSVAEVRRVLAEYTSEAQLLQCVSAPKHPITVADRPDRPQPRLDRDTHGGNSVTVGRIRPCPVLDLKFTLLVHNTVLGAAGSSILNAELAVAKGVLKPLDN